jgi:1,4-dihydroxy-2-naphthoate octaprenyltransferase
MTIVSITAGSLYAYSILGRFDISIYMVTLAGAVLLHAFVNLSNDYFDTIYGVDRPGAPTTRYRPHPIISGIMTPSQALIISASIFAMAFLAGLYLAIIDRWLSIPLGLVGALIALEYTAPPAKLKYRGLGEVSVFLMWGPLMVLGSFYTQAGFLDVKPILVSIPLGILVASVLLIDSIRDYEYDRSSGIKTLAVIIGRGRALSLFTAMIAISYAMPAALYLLGVARIWILATMVTAPRAYRLVRSFYREVPDTAAPQTAQLTMIYGSLDAISFLVNI